MADFKSKSAEKISERKRGKRTVFLAVVGVLIIAGVVLIYNFGYAPSVGNYTRYTQEEVELIANNSYPAMKEVILTRMPIVTGCIAAETDNLSVCDLLDTEERKSICYREYYSYFMLTEDCEKLGSYKEDAKTDMDLHHLADRAIGLSATGQVLDMSNYDEIVDVPNEETKRMTDLAGIRK